MTTCILKSDICPTCPSRCYLDLLNIEYINNQNTSNKLDMPWANQTITDNLINYKYPPQRILFDLPFVYFIKLVFLLMSSISYYTCTVILKWILVVWPQMALRLVSLATHCLHHVSTTSHWTLQSTQTFRIGIIILTTHW